MIESIERYFCIMFIIKASFVKRIESFAFFECKELTEVSRIGISSFEGCSSLIELKFPSSLSQIDDYVFYGCHSLVSITFSSYKLAVGKGAFWNCHSVEQITIPFTELKPFLESFGTKVQIIAAL